MSVACIRYAVLFVSFVGYLTCPCQLCSSCFTVDILLCIISRPWFVSHSISYSYPQFNFISLFKFILLWPRPSSYSWIVSRSSSFRGVSPVQFLVLDLSPFNCMFFICSPFSSLWYWRSGNSSEAEIDRVEEMHRKKQIEKFCSHMKKAIFKVMQWTPKKLKRKDYLAIWKHSVAKWKKHFKRMQ